MTIFRDSVPAPSPVHDLSTLIAQARRNLPAQMYAKLLHIAVTTGVLPTLTPDGTPTDEAVPIPPMKRIDLLVTLMNKTVPDYTPPSANTTAPDVPDNLPDDPSLRQRTLRTMTTNELRALRAAATPTPLLPSEIDTGT